MENSQAAGRQGPRLQAALPAGLVCAAYLLVFFQTDFLSWAGIEPSLWTTRGNGFVLNFSVCLRYSRVEAPEDYSQEALSAIALETEEGSSPPEVDGTQPVNLIVIMNESFSDLSEVFGLETNEDPMPFFHSLTENTIRGTAYSSVFGGTTANSEYEFLTGNTMAFLPEGSVPFHLYVTDGAPNLGAQMKALGYRTVFLHPYLASGWNRRAVYQDFGFDEIYFQDAIEDPDYMRGYITDQSDYEKPGPATRKRSRGSPSSSSMSPCRATAPTTCLGQGWSGRSGLPGTSRGATPPWTSTSPCSGSRTWPWNTSSTTSPRWRSPP